MSTRSVSSTGSDFELAYASPVVVRLKGGDSESVERHEKQRRERVFSDELGKLEADGRKRRHRGSSDDDGEVAWDGFVNEDLRVGGPFLSPPCLRLSIRSLDHTTSLNASLSPGNQVFANALSIVVSHHIACQDIAVVEKTSLFNPESVTITLSIIARRTKLDDTWLRASRAIRTFLVTEGLMTVAVEIADPDAFRPNQLFPILRSDAIFTLWDGVRDAILGEIDLSDVRVVGCYRFGKSLSSQDNPPTVIVIVDPKSTRLWKATREIVIRILNRFHLPMVAVSVFKDNIRRGCVSSAIYHLSPDIFLGQAKLGQSLGPSCQGALSGSGTFGGFIQLKHPETGEWHTYGLTCFRCVIPSQEDRRQLDPKFKQKLEAWKSSGVGMCEEDARRLLTIDHPTQKDMSDKIEALNDEITRISTSSVFGDFVKTQQESLADTMPRADRNFFAAAKREIQSSKELIDNISTFRARNRQYLGYVVAASGIRRGPCVSIKGSPLNTSLDWALIQVVKERQGLNSLGDSGVELTQPERELLSDFADTSVYLYGRSSGHSVGRYNGLHDAVIHAEMIDGKVVEVATLEHSVIGIRGNPFSREGDAGVPCTF